MFPKFALCLLGLLLIFVPQGFAVICYYCVGSPSSDCARGSTGTMLEQPCNSNVRRPLSYPASNELEEHGNEPEDGITTWCLSLQGTEQNVTFYERQCAVMPSGIDVCKYVAKYVKVASCKACTTDLCNS